MGGSEERLPAAVEAIAGQVRALATEPWRRADVSSRYVSRMVWATTLRFELTDGTTRTADAPPGLTAAITSLSRYLPSLVWRFACTLTPTEVVAVEVDAESDPYPDGWEDVLQLRALEDLLPDARRPEWLRRRLAELGKRPSRPALWTAAVHELLDALGPEWDHRGSGNDLRLVRMRSPWLVDVVLMERTRAALGANVHVTVDGLVDGGDQLRLTRSATHHIDTLERPDARRRITAHVLGDGSSFLAGWTPDRWGNAAIRRVDGVHFMAGNANHQSRDLIEAAAWQLTLDPTTPDPIAPRALEATRQYATLNPIDARDAAATEGRLRNAEELVAIARLDPPGRVEAMRARALAKLAAIGLDESNRKPLRTPR